MTLRLTFVFEDKAPTELAVEIRVTQATRDVKVLRPVAQEEGDDYPGYPCPEDPDGLHHIGCGCEW